MAKTRNNVLQVWSEKHQKTFHIETDAHTGQVIRITRVKGENKPLQRELPLAAAYGLDTPLTGD